MLLSLLLIIIIALGCILKGHFFYTITSCKRFSLSSDRKIGLTSRSFQRSYSTSNSNSNSNSNSKTPVLNEPLVTFKNFIDDRALIHDAIRSKSYIYLLKNNITGQLYIGQSSKGLDRISNYITEYRSLLCSKMRIKSPLWQNIKKHGLNNFSFTILEIVGEKIKGTNISTESKVIRDELNALEKKYIIRYAELYPDLILNVRLKKKI